MVNDYSAVDVCFQAVYIFILLCLYFFSGFHCACCAAHSDICPGGSL